MRIVCLASGPSLAKDDVEFIRDWRGPGRQVIAVNRTFEIAPWADHFVGCDRTFWLRYGKLIQPLGGVMWSASEKIEYANRLPQKFGNSGATAIYLAQHLGAMGIYLLGYDLSYRNGRRHWHDDYPRGMGNAGSIKSWGGHFDALTISVPVVNCTADSALRKWPYRPI